MGDKVTGGSDWRARAAVVGGMGAVSFASIFVKLSKSSFLVIAADRLLVSAFLLAPAALVAWRRSQRTIASIVSKDMLLMAGAGCCLAVHFPVWFASLRYTTVASSCLFVTLHPIFVSVIGWVLLRERITRQAFLGITAALVGSILLAYGDLQVSGQALYGDALALIGAATMAGYLLTGRSVRQRHGALFYSFCVYSTSGIILAWITIASGQSVLKLPASDWLCVLGMALVCTIGGHTLMNYALRYLPATTVSTAYLFEPVGASLLAFLILSEVPRPETLIGGVFILVGIYNVLR